MCCIDLNAFYNIMLNHYKTERCALTIVVKYFLVGEFVSALTDDNAKDAPFAPLKTSFKIHPCILVMSFGRFQLLCSN